MEQSPAGSSEMRSDCSPQGWGIGTVVESLAGRDKGYLLCVIGWEDGCVLVADGKERPLERPKKKNPNHLAPLLQLQALTWELRGNKALRKALNRMEYQLKGD